MARSPRDLVDNMSDRQGRRKLKPDNRLSDRDDGFVRESFKQPRETARRTARAFLDRFPKQAYMSEVERWRELPDGEIEFTMRRLPTAD